MPTAEGITWTAINGTASTSHTVDLPGTINSGDILVMYGNCGTGGSEGAITVPSGWTSRAQVNQNFRGTAFVFTRVADGSEGSTVSLSSADSKTFLVGVGRYSATDSYDTIAADTEWDTTDDGSIETPAVTPSNADSMVLSFAAQRHYGGSDFGLPDGVTLDGESGDASQRIEVGYYTHGASSTGTKDWSGRTTNGQDIGFQVVLAPSVGGGSSISPLAMHHLNRMRHRGDMPTVPRGKYRRSLSGLLIPAWAREAA